jgi:hypothetical protein
MLLPASVADNVVTCCGLLRHRCFSCSLGSLRAAGAAGLHLGEVVAATGSPEGPVAGAPGYLWHPCTASN